MTSFTRAYPFARSMLTLAANIIFPPDCAMCQTPVQASGSVCAACFASLSHISAPYCIRCGNPFAYEIDKGALCADCTQWLPPYDMARAALCYDEHSRALITRFKYRDATHLAPYLSRMMTMAAQPVLDKAQLIIPVPLHPRRLRTRRYNQSMLLASQLAKHSGKHCRADVLKRIRHTIPQAGLDAKARADNVADVFVVPLHKQALVENAHIMLVDDVMTTGATIHACTHALRNAGAAWVGVVTLAKRVLDDTL